MQEIEQKLVEKIDRFMNKTFKFKFDRRVKDSWFSTVIFSKNKRNAGKETPA